MTPEAIKIMRTATYIDADAFHDMALRGPLWFMG